MKTVDNSFPSTSFEEFAGQHGLVMEIHEHPASLGLGPGSRYFASFHGVEVSEPGILVGKYGNGATKEEAIADYAKKLRGQRLVVGAYTDKRREIQCPNEWERV